MKKPGIQKLVNPIRPYDWGSKEFIAKLQSRPTPSREPEAELWVGAHPAAPSRLADGTAVSLVDAIDRDPVGMLGVDSVERFGPTLPFLVKLLAAAQPLSIQVHPNADQARHGFEAEEARGLARDAPDRNYSDPFRKIELMIALEPFAALCGFRASASCQALVGTLGSPLLDALCAELPTGSSEEATARLFFTLRALPIDRRRALLAEVVDRARRPDVHVTEFDWIERLAEQHPNDIGALAPLLLNLVDLAPGEALFVEPGTLHSYLEGSGIEVMSASDNVVRGGLTTKHVDAGELKRLASMRAIDPTIVRPRDRDAGIQHFALPGEGADEFSVRTLTPTPDGRAIQRPASRTAKILLCVDGTCTLRAAPAPHVSLSAGDAAWLPASIEDHIVELAPESESTCLYEVMIA